MEINILIEEGLTGCPDAGWFERLMADILKAQNAGSNAEVSLVITGQDRIRELNRAYRGIDEPTDVLSFFMTGGGSEPDAAPFVQPPDGMAHLGEVIISCPQAAIQAEEHGHSIRKEMAILVIHGVLHLLGYDHAEPGPEQEMRARETAVLAEINPRLDPSI